MRINAEDILFAKNKEKNTQLIDDYKKLMLDLAFLNNQLFLLGQSMAAAEAEPALSDDYSTLKTYISTVKNYLKTIQCINIFDFKINKMSDKDIAVFNFQVASIKKMRAQLENPDSGKDNLSKLIEDASKL